MGQNTYSSYREMPKEIPDKASHHMGQSTCGRGRGGAMGLRGAGLTGEEAMDFEKTNQHPWPLTNMKQFFLPGKDYLEPPARVGKPSQGGEATPGS